jgi:HEPN domain-containing protein
MADRGHEGLARLLLSKARGNEAAVAALLADDKVPDDVVGFHAHRAVEKALKAVLAVRGIEYAFGHDLAYLADLLDANSIKVPGELRGAEELRPWAAEFRYEDPPTGSSGLDRERALQLAASATGWAAADLQARS